MKMALLATGDEIVCGDTLNTNSHALAQILNSEGHALGLQMVCGDAEDDINHSLNFLCKRHDYIVITGGLGPTCDDRTRFALARFLNVPLVEYAEAVIHVQTRLSKAGLKMNQGNHQQTLFPKGAKLLPNPFGTAMGCIVSGKNKQFIVLPGPPKECLPMFQSFVVSNLPPPNNKFSLLKWRLFGVAEGDIAQTLEQALDSVECELGFRLEMPYLEFKVRCSHDKLSEVQSIVEPLVANHIIACPKAKASERLHEFLTTLNEPIGIEDEVTGGILQELLHTPDTHTSVYFHRHHQARVQFHILGLEDYWCKVHANATTLTIKYHNGTEYGSETHTIPYRSSFVTLYAAEWLCFRLFQLIKQLH